MPILRNGARPPRLVAMKKRPGGRWYSIWRDVGFRNGIGRGGGLCSEIVVSFICPDDYGGKIDGEEEDGLTPMKATRPLDMGDFTSGDIWIVYVA